MIISTILFREIKKQYPNIKIFVLCGKDNKNILKNNPYVDTIFISHNKFFRDIILYKKLRKLKIDLVIDFLLFRPKPLHLLKLRIINSKFLLGICKENYNVYDISVDVNYNIEHISKIYYLILNSLGIKHIDIKYDVFLSDEDEDYAKQFIKENKLSKILFFNTHSASKYRTLSFKKVKELLKLLFEKENFKIILNSQYDIKIKNVITLPKSNFLKVLAIAKYSDVILTVDTSIVHAANAFNKKMIALYNNDFDTEEKLSKVWAPNYEKAIQLISKTKDINGISNLDIINAINKLLKIN
jgi:ADP-heptose:LPS heptosyltransferase